MERNTRRTLTGVVVANTNDKTITVVVSTSKKHPLYNKDFTVTKNIELTMKITKLKLVIL